jgi:hypothetical protein
MSSDVLNGWQSEPGPICGLPGRPSVARYFFVRSQKLECRKIDEILCTAHR